MKKLLGIALVIVGVIAGMYAGIWWAFIGGIVNCVEAVRADELVTRDLATGVAKVMFAGLIGWCSAVLFVLPGIFLVQSE